MDNLVNLRVLSLAGKINEDFNFELFKNLSYQLENITIGLRNIDEKTLTKQFDGYNFPCLRDFTLKYFNINRLRKEVINRFSMLRRLFITNCKIEVIESDSFSNFKQLTWLDLSENLIKLIEENENVLIA